MISCDRRVVLRLAQAPFNPCGVLLHLHVRLDLAARTYTVQIKLELQVLCDLPSCTYGAALLMPDSWPGP